MLFKVSSQTTAGLRIVTDLLRKNMEIGRKCLEIFTVTLYNLTSVGSKNKTYKLAFHFSSNSFTLYFTKSSNSNSLGGEKQFLSYR